MKNSAKGFASANPIIHKFQSAKGGKRRVKKGFATLSPEQLRKVSAQGGKAKYANKAKEIEEQST